MASSEYSQSGSSSSTCKATGALGTWNHQKPTCNISKDLSQLYILDQTSNISHAKVEYISLNVYYHTYSLSSDILHTKDHNFE